MTLTVCLRTSDDHWRWGVQRAGGCLGLSLGPLVILWSPRYEGRAVWEVLTERWEPDPWDEYPQIELVGLDDWPHDPDDHEVDDSRSRCWQCYGEGGWMDDRGGVEAWRDCEECGGSGWLDWDDEEEPLHRSVAAQAAGEAT